MKVTESLHFFQWTNPTANNCNTVFINGPKRILIDPGHGHLFGHVKEGLSRLGLSPSQMDLVIITHAHPDHVESVTAFADYRIPIAMHSAELAFIKSMAPHLGAALGMPDLEPQLLLREGDMNVGGLGFKILHSPGHSPGSVCIFWPGEKVLITGDVVFDQGIGRTDLPGGNGQQLKESIRRIAQLDVTCLLPGHGGMVSGEDAVRTNFKVIQEYWFNFI